MDRLSRRLSDHAFDLLVDAYYYDNPGGGNLHIVLDEGGTSDGCLLLCLRYAMAEGDWIGMAIADEMLRMDVGDRFDYHSFVNARAERRRRGEPEAEEEVRFSLVAPPARKGVRG